MKRSTIVLLSAGAVLLAAAVFFFGFLPGLAEGAMNKTVLRDPSSASPRARALHGTLAAADLHADSLLFGRDLLVRGDRGHVDIPRMAEGRLALQAFTVVTQVPLGQNIRKNNADSDIIGFLAVAGLWDPAAWTSKKERALWQASRLADTEKRSAGAFRILRSKKDLAAFLSDRQSQPALAAGFLGLEGVQALEGKVENLDALEAAGFRMIGLCHFFDNEFAGSAHGTSGAGLSDRGRALVRRLDERSLIIDLAHASEASVRDVLAAGTRPVVVSHTGLKGVVDNPRNLSDELAKAIAARGGLIGIGQWDVAVGEATPDAIARTIVYGIGLVGADHIALGSDWDGTVTAAVDASGLVLVTDALLRQGLTEDQVRAVMGGNVVRFLGQALPD